MATVGYQAINGQWVLLTATVLKAPSAPRSMAASTPGTPASRTATVSWLAPASNGGSPLTSYVPSITPAPSIALPASLSPSATSLVINGLADGVAYKFQLSAVNAIGPSAPASVNFTADAAGSGLPAAPLNLVVSTPGTGGSKVATASWNTPSNGGSALTGYVVTLTGTHAALSNPGAGAVTQGLSGLVDNTSYTYTIAAVNANGTGPASTYTFKSDPAVISSLRFAGDPGLNKIRLGTNTGKYTVAQFETQIGTRGPTVTPSGQSNPYNSPHTTIVREYNNTTFGPNWTTIDNHITAGRITIMSWLTGAYTLDQLANDLGTAQGGTATGDAINSDLAAINTAAASRAPHAIWFSFYHEPEDNFTTAVDKANYRKAFRRQALAITAANVAWVGPIYMGWSFKNATRDWKTWNPDWDDTNKRWLSPCYDIEGVDIYNPGVGGAVTMKTWMTQVGDFYNVRLADNAPVRPYAICEYGLKSDYTQTETPTMYLNETIAEAPVHQNGDGGCVALIMWNTWKGTQTSPGPSFDSVGDPTGEKCAAFRWIMKDSKVINTVP